MRMSSTGFTSAIAVAVLSTALAQETRTTTRVILAGSARVERIDLSTRSLIVRTTEGIVHTVYVPRDLKVFNELKAGDTVDVRVAEEVIVALNPRGRPTVLVDSTADARKAAAGETEVLQQLKATVTIVSVDLQLQVVVYKTADNRQVMRQVADPKLLEGLKAGDVIDITYTRERAACGLAQSGMLSDSQRRSAVPRLLDYADDGGMDRQTHEWVFQALRDITGQSLPHDAQVWRQWYRTAAR